MNLVLVVGLLITVLTGAPVFLQLRRHPRGLATLFFAEMWERFSYYGMRAILIFYLTQHFLFDDRKAQAQYGAYTSLIFLLPLLGGVIADRWLGTRKAILFGGALLVLGHLGMGIEGPPATQTLTYAGASYDFEITGRGEAQTSRLLFDGVAHPYGPAPGGGMRIDGLTAGAPLPSVLAPGSYAVKTKGGGGPFESVMYLALSLIIIGVGFLKPNISTLVGQLYPKGDPRRDSGFTLYYYGVNLGSFWAGILCGWLGMTVGWWAGFGAAGLGMLAGLVVFVLGRRKLDGHGEPPDPAALKAPIVGPLTPERLIYLGAFAAVFLVWKLVDQNAAVGWLLGAGSVAVLAYLSWHMVTRCTKEETQRILLALVLMAGAAAFWTLFEQAGSSLNQFAQRNTSLSVGFGQSITASQTQSFNPGFILLFAPAFAGLWAWLGSRGRDPNPVAKFGFALLQAGLGFLLLVWGARFADEAFRVPLLFLLLAYMLHTTGELCLSPVGLSQMTKLSTAAVAATVMATWFLAQAWAQWVGGLIAQMTAAETVAGQVLDPAKALATYVSVFTHIGLIGAGIGLLFLLLSPWLKRWAHGASDTHPLSHATVDADRQAMDA